MKRCPRYRLLTLLSVGLVGSSAHAGAWVQEKGRGLAITQGTYYTTDRYFDSSGKSHSQPRYTKYELQPYVEYGLLPNLTIGGSAYAQRVSQSGNKNFGIADPEIFARTRLWKDGKQVISLQPLIKFPGTYDGTTTPSGGSRSTDGEISLLYGRSQPLATPDDYTDLRIGYRVRNRGLHDQIRVDATVGIKWNEHLELAPALRGTFTTGMDKEAIYRESADQDYHVLKVELGGIYHLNERQWLQATLFSQVAGLQTGGGYGISVGFAQRF